MTEPVVLDTNVFIVSLLDPGVLNEEERKQRPFAMDYLNRLLDRTITAHLPRIAVVEIIGVARRKAGESIATVMKARLLEWEGLGMIELHILDEIRMTQAIDLVLRYNQSSRRFLSAADALFISLAQELDAPVVSFEKYFPQIYPWAVVPQ